MLDLLLKALRQQDRRALARLLTRANDPGERESIARSIEAFPPRSSHVIALTGSAGVGKSTLVGRLIESIRALGETVAVLACDPESPLTGGALLGDRFRMPGQPDEGVFIRSLATPEGSTVTKALDIQIRLLECFGFDWILIETVGAGQGDTSIRDRVDGLVVLLQSEAGDDLQWEKAGLVEVADVLVIHKADLPGSAQVEAQVLAMLSLGHRPVPPVVCASSRTGQGLNELLGILRKMPTRRHNLKTAQRLLAHIHQRLEHQLHQAEATNCPDLEKLLQRWQADQMNQSQAEKELMDLLQTKTR